MKGLVWLVVLATACRQVAGLDDPVPSTTVTVDHDTIDLSTVSCGASKALTLVIANGAAQAVNYTITSDTPGITTDPTTGTIPATLSAQVTVTATADAIATPGAEVSGILQIETDDPDVPSIQVPIKFQPAGAVVTADHTTVDFGQVAANTSHGNMVTLTNTGNAPVQVMAGPFASGTFAVTSPSSFELAPQASQPVDISFDPPLAQAYMYQLPLVMTGAVCAMPPTVVVLGAGSTNPVLLDHTSLDFGNVMCGSSSANTMLTMTNSNASSYPFTATVTAGASAFSVAPGSGTLPASGMASVTVTRAAVPTPIMTGQVSGNLAVAITGQGTTDVPLTYNVSGAYLTASSTTMYIQTVVGQSSTRSVTITNSGDQVATVMVNETGSNELTSALSFQVAPGAMQTFSVTFSPTVTGTVTASFDLVASNACSPPLTIMVTGSIDN